MRKLAPARIELIDAVVAESEQSGITAGLLEKDEHLTDALRAVFALEFEHAKLVFCGGTSLSKAHGLIERMSEDADIKVVLTETGRALSRTKIRRYLGDEVRQRVAKALADLGFVEDTEKAKSLNEHRYIHSQWSYERAYESASGLRPNLQLELTTRDPTLPTTGIGLLPLVDRLAGRTEGAFNVESTSVAETQAEKVLSFLRRFAQQRSGQMKGDWDTALVRHIYDVHCISTHSALLGDSCTAFAALVQGDIAEFGKQSPDFSENPTGVMTAALDQARAEQQTRDEYEKNLLPLIYGDFKPTFAEAFATFEQVARMLLAAPGSGPASI